MGIIVGKFEKVSFEQFKKDCIKTFGLESNDDTIKLLEDAYDKLELPKRGTNGSAGYDFHIPFGVYLRKNDVITIPTGIRCKISDGWFLEIVPRSSYGFKYRMMIANTVPIIDSDYYNAENEGHIMIKISFDSFLFQGYDKNYELNQRDDNGIYLSTRKISQLKPTETMELHQNDRFVQGIFLPYGITEDDDSDKENFKDRIGGIGSTGK